MIQRPWMRSELGFPLEGPFFVGGKNQAGFVQLALTKCPVINVL